MNKRIQNKAGRIARMGALALVMSLSGAGQSAMAQDWVTTQSELLDRIQIEDIMVGYYAGLDSDSDHGFGSYYTEDGVMDVNGKVARGRDGIQAFYKNYSTMSPGEALPGKLHVMLNNMRIVVDGDKATVHLIWTEVNSDTIKLAPRVVEQGVDDTELKKVNGRWLITKRVITSSGGLPDAYDDSFKPR